MYRMSQCIRSSILNWCLVPRRWSLAAKDKALVLSIGCALCTAIVLLAIFVVNTNYGPILRNHLSIYKQKWQSLIWTAIPVDIMVCCYCTSAQSMGSHTCTYTLVRMCPVDDSFVGMELTNVFIPYGMPACRLH